MQNGLFVPDKIRLHSGKYIDPLNPSPEDICIEDIAHGLSNECRFASHPQEFLSVAEHSIWVCIMSPQHLKLPALLHDASEGLGLRDLPTPVKYRFPEYKAAEKNLMRVIGEKFGFTLEELESVKDRDFDALNNEFANMVVEHNYSAMSPGAAKLEFLRLYEKYKRV